MPKYEEKELSWSIEDPLRGYKKSIFDRCKWYITQMTQLIRKENTLHLPPAHSTRHGIDSLLFRVSYLWINLPREIKESLSTEEFKKRLKENGDLPYSCVVYR